MSVLRYRDFRLLFLGQSASVIGDNVVLVALALYVTKLTGSPVDVGIVLASGTIPFVSLLLIGGVWADRLPRNRVMLVADLIRGTLHAILAALIFSGEVRVWEIAAIQFLFGSAWAFFQPAYTGLLPQTVPEEHVQQGRALVETVSNLARLVGPALATLLVLSLGAGDAFALDAATFFLSAFLLSQVRPRRRGSELDTGSVLEHLRDGWQEVRSRTWVLVTIFVFTGVLMCLSAPWQTLGPSEARHRYGSLAFYGLFVSLSGVGSVAGSLLALRWRPRHALWTGMLLVLSWPLQAGLLALGAPAYTVAVVSLAGGLGFGLLIVWWETSLAHHIPPHALSRVSSYDWMAALGLLPVGFLASGPLAELVGRRAVLGGGAVLALCFLIVGCLPRQTRELETPAITASAEDQPSISRAISA